MAARQRCNGCAARFPLVYVSLMAVIVACTRFQSTSGNVLHESAQTMDNMLRDVSANTNTNQQPAAVHAARRAANGSGKNGYAMSEILRKDNNAINGNDNDNDNDNDSEIDIVDNNNRLETQSSVELLRFVNDVDVATNAAQQQHSVAAQRTPAGAPLSLQDQVQLLSKQLSALMLRRREDYELLEHNLRKSLRISSDAATTDLDIRNELEQLRHEVANLRNGHLLTGNKERLTVEWLQQSITELRKQLVELQQIAGDTSKNINHRTQSYEDLATIRNDFRQLKLELAALQERQQQTEVYVQELREETLQQEEDYKHLLHKGQNLQALKKLEHTQEESAEEVVAERKDDELDNTPLADHRRRHCRFQRQQIHELQLAQRSLKEQLNELKYHRIAERVRNIEIEQHRIADANFNLSRQIAALDKLHTSMLELLEDVESLQTKMDKSIPDLRHEISKLEFSNAQLVSEQSLVREEGKNVARSVQAMAVSVSTLQEERDGIKQMQAAITQLQANVDRLQSMMQDAHRALMHHRRGGEHKSSHSPKHHQPPTHHIEQNTPTNNDTAKGAEALVAKLENVEEAYESIIHNLPQDCSEVSTAGAAGFFMILPAGQQRPRMVHCSADGWTTVQRRFDGSADFNRSWEDYAAGFGAPTGEYWVGNEQLHHLTRNNCTQLRVLMQDIYDNVWLAQYSNFYVSSRADGYRLHTGGYSGNASDALDYQQGMQFSAIDVDRDISQTHCAANYEGGWWFSHCQHANLNGRYNLGLTWFDAARNEWIAVKSSQMLIKRQPAATCGASSHAYVVAADARPYVPTVAATVTAAASNTTPATIVSSRLAAASAEAATSAATPLSHAAAYASAARL